MVNHFRYFHQTKVETTAPNVLFSWCVLFGEQKYMVLLLICFYCIVKFRRIDSISAEWISKHWIFHRNRKLPHVNSFSDSVGRVYADFADESAMQSVLLSVKSKMFAQTGYFYALLFLDLIWFIRCFTMYWNTHKHA